MSLVAECFDLDRHGKPVAARVATTDATHDVLGWELLATCVVCFAEVQRKNAEAHAAYHHRPAASNPAVPS